MLYEVLLGERRGPRFGSFVALYGVAETRALIDKALAGALLEAGARGHLTGHARRRRRYSDPCRAWRRRPRTLAEPLGEQTVHRAPRRAARLGRADPPAVGRDDRASGAIAATARLSSSRHSLGVVDAFCTLRRAIAERDRRRLSRRAAFGGGHATSCPASIRAFLLTPRARLAFPAVLVGSSDDPYADLLFPRQFARDIGAQFIDAGASGHINIDSGHGPWPEGSIAFANFVSKL